MVTDEATRIQDVGIAAMLRAGSEDGLRQLLRVYGPRIKWLLKDRFGDFLPDPDLSAVLNEAILKVFTAIAMFDRSRGSLGTWFWLIAANTARDMIRRELRHVHRDLEQDPCEPGRQPASIDDGEASASQQVSRGFDRRSLRCRTCSERSSGRIWPVAAWPVPPGWPASTPPPRPASTCPEKRHETTSGKKCSVGGIFRSRR